MAYSSILHLKMLNYFTLYTGYRGLMIKPTGRCAMPLGNFIPHGLKVSWNDHKVFRSAFLCCFFLCELNLADYFTSKRRFFAKIQ